MSQCSDWAGQDPLMTEYHNNRWCRPCHDDRKLFAMLCLEGQQAGLSWSTVIHKEKGIRKAFDGFAIETVAGYGDEKIEELLLNPNIIRSRMKIKAAVSNAQAVLRMITEGMYASLDEYIWHFTEGRQVIHHPRSLDEIPGQNDLSVQVSRDMKKRGFKFVGPVICYSYLQGTGVIDDHLEDCPYKSGNCR